MTENRRLSIMIIIFLGIFLMFFTEITFAQESASEVSLKEYVSSGYNGNILSHRNSLLRFQAENNQIGRASCRERV